MQVLKKGPWHQSPTCSCYYIYIYIYIYTESRQQQTKDSLLSSVLQHSSKKGYLLVNNDNVTSIFLSPTTHNMGIVLVLLLPQFIHENEPEGRLYRVVVGLRWRSIQYFHSQAPHPGNIRHKRSGSMASCISC